MVVGVITSVFHLSPVFPAKGEIVAAWVPDPLAPDDVHDIEFLVVLLNPLSYLLALGVAALFVAVLANLSRGYSMKLDIYMEEKVTYSDHEV